MYHARSIAIIATDPLRSPPENRYTGFMILRSAIFFLLAVAALAQDTGRMDQLVQSYGTSRQFMGSVLVARGSEVLFSKGYGSANLE